MQGVGQECSITDTAVLPGNLSGFDNNCILCLAAFVVIQGVHPPLRIISVDVAAVAADQQTCWAAVVAQVLTHWPMTVWDVSTCP